MLTYLVRRLPSVVFLLVATSIVAFALPRLTPGDPAIAVAGPDASPEALELIRQEMGLDQPPVAQYFAWVGGVLTGNLGLSFTTNRPVAELIGSRLTSTLELAIVAGILMVVIGIALGVATATTRRPLVRAVLDGANSALLAAPPFLTGLFLILVLGILVPILPISGEVSLLEDPVIGIQYLILPALALALPQAASIGRLVATSMRTTAEEDFVDLAAAKGVSRSRIVSRHILRNSMGPALVTIGLRFGELLAGAIVIEAIFARHGLGSLAVTSVQTRDYLVIQVLILGAVAIAVLMQVLTDIGVASLDPRIRLGASA
ncbi:ABC transporter permease [Microbacterium sulfonylureivorans]|uniref:ABC transporter permease n=1 Tax=Microbacterium sulfonylureivorans TaxID=2486854 RepID=UPI000FD75EE5|nr:ABC transporter permease [Microbacterium sulfonylureivorans]